MDIASLVHSVAYTPPPLALKGLPYEFASLLATPQPTFAYWPGAFTSQFVVVIVPVKLPLLLFTEHPELV